MTETGGGRAAELSESRRRAAVDLLAREFCGLLAAARGAGGDEGSSALDGEDLEDGGRDARDLRGIGE